MCTDVQRSAACCSCHLSTSRYRSRRQREPPPYRSTIVENDSWINKRRSHVSFAADAHSDRFRKLRAWQIPFLSRIRFHRYGRIFHGKWSKIDVSNCYLYRGMRESELGVKWILWHFKKYDTKSIGFMSYVIMNGRYHINSIKYDSRWCPR